MRQRMAVTRTAFALAAGIGLPSCIFDSGELWRDGPYVVEWIDTGENVTLYYDVENGGAIARVGPKIASIGSNSAYVVVRQRIAGTENYYVIDRSKDRPYANASEVVTGPLSNTAFLEQQKRLTLPHFSREFP